MTAIDYDDLFTLQMLGNDSERRIFLELQKENEMSGYDLINKTKFPQTTVYRKLKQLQKVTWFFPLGKEEHLVKSSMMFYFQGLKLM